MSWMLHFFQHHHTSAWPSDLSVQQESKHLDNTSEFGMVIRLWHCHRTWRHRQSFESHISNWIGQTYSLDFVRNKISYKIVINNINYSLLWAWKCTYVTVNVTYHYYVSSSNVKSIDIFVLWCCDLYLLIFFCILL